jgi:hypothetical protein
MLYSYVGGSHSSWGEKWLNDGCSEMISFHGTKNKRSCPLMERVGGWKSVVDQRKETPNNASHPFLPLFPLVEEIVSKELTRRIE